MSDKPENSPAFPACNEANVNGTMGMTLRDYFAGQALAGMRLSDGMTSKSILTKGKAESAYALADAMLEARAKGDPS